MIVPITQHARKITVVERVENFIKDYVTFEDDSTGFVIALWTIATHFFQFCDSFAYVVITSMTKRSGKTRLAEVIATMAKNPQQFSAMTPATLFRSIEQFAPTIIFDEAECLSSESASTMRAVLNVGYRQGAKIPRTIGNEIVQFSTYCPKVFILIGDVYDTLRDRSIVVMLQRNAARELKRFSFAEANNEGTVIQTEFMDAMKQACGNKIERFTEEYANTQLDWLSDRDAEIWRPVFTVCKILCSHRYEELQRISVDMASEKTGDRRRYTQLANIEEKMQDDEYAKRLLKDVHACFASDSQLFSTEIMERLLAMNTAPWRKYKGDGLTMRLMANMLSRFGVRQSLLRSAGGRKNSKVGRGYKLEQITKAIHATKG